MKIEEMRAAIKANFAAVENYRRTIAPETGARIALTHFQDSFRNQGFTDKALVKWKDVKRRDPNSAWYGFERYGTAPRRGEKKRKKGDPVKTTNFSPNATKRNILLPKGSKLFASIKSTTGDATFKILSDRPHASVHNYGEPAMIFGKKTFTMPKRQFIGDSQVLRNKLRRQYLDDLMKITGVK